MATIETSDIDLVRHSLGAVRTNRRSKWGYRNYFSCGEGDRPAMDRLVEAGLMKPVGQPSDITGGCQTFTVTEQGCDFIGLTPSQKKRAFSN